MDAQSVDGRQISRQPEMRAQDKYIVTEPNYSISKVGNAYNRASGLDECSARVLGAGCRGQVIAPYVAPGGAEGFPVKRA